MRPDRHKEEFLRYLEAEKNVSAHTISAYRTSIEAFRTFRPSPAWAEVSADDYRAGMLELMKRGMARASVRLRFASLRAFHAFLLLRRVVARNVLVDVLLPKKEKQLPRFLTTSQVTNLVEAPAKHEKTKQAPVWMATRDTAITGGAGCRGCGSNQRDSARDGQGSAPKGVSGRRSGLGGYFKIPPSCAHS